MSANAIVSTNGANSIPLSLLGLAPGGMALAPPGLGVAPMSVAPQGVNVFVMPPQNGYPPQYYGYGYGYGYGYPCAPYGGYGYSSGYYPASSWYPPPPGR